MRTDAAVTPMRWIAAPFAAFTALYLFLAVVVVVLLRRQFLQTSVLCPFLEQPQPMLELIVAIFILLSLIVYALMGGADFGGGMWDLLAAGPRASGKEKPSPTPSVPFGRPTMCG